MTFAMNTVKNPDHPIFSYLRPKYRRSGSRAWWELNPGLTALISLNRDSANGEPLFHVTIFNEDDNMVFTGNVDILIHVQV